ncbi:MAG: hypothetical protein J6Y08_04645 [Clostridiales bacterium]|nr:hypothetical protein [Clostridiales bacterium]
MKAFIESLKKRRDILRTCIALSEKGVKIDVQGHLEISDKGKKCDYYHVQIIGSKHGRYIPKGKLSTAIALAQRDYFDRTLLRMKKELHSLEQYIQLVENGTVEDVYSRMCPARQKLVKPLIVSDEMLAQRWLQGAFNQSEYMPEKKIYPTKKGDMVRSKSEVLFADLYLDMGIPYRYEPVIVMKNGHALSPDFSLWDTKRRQEIYHEHFGLMDDPDYRRNALKKIDEYRQNGIYIGKNLITTFEGDGAILNMKEIRAMIEELLL